MNKHKEDFIEHFGSNEFYPVCLPLIEIVGNYAAQLYGYIYRRSGLKNRYCSESYNTIGKTLGFNAKTVYRHIHALKDLGLIRDIKPTKSIKIGDVRWFICVPKRLKEVTSISQILVNKTMDSKVETMDSTAINHGLKVQEDSILDNNKIVIDSTKISNFSVPEGIIQSNATLNKTPLEKELPVAVDPPTDAKPPAELLKEMARQGWTLNEKNEYEKIVKSNEGISMSNIKSKKISIER